MEPALFSRKHKYAGSADLFCTAQKPHAPARTRVLADYKTSASGPWGSVAFQLSAYRFADFMLSGDGGKQSEELPVPEVDECWAVWIRGDGYDVWNPIDTSPEILPPAAVRRPSAAWRMRNAGTTRATPCRTRSGCARCASSGRH